MRTETCSANEESIAGRRQIGSCPCRGRWYGVQQVTRASVPWHRGADRFLYLCDAVAAWLNAPTPGWRTDPGSGLMAGYLFGCRELSSDVLDGYELTAPAFSRLLLSCSVWGSAVAGAFSVAACAATDA